MHVHVYSGDGEAKFWLEPEIELAKNYKLSKTQVTIIRKIIEEHEDEIKSAWQKWFIR
jgi:hypothetical protein